MTINFDAPDPDYDLGARVFDLLNLPGSWTHRRVEGIKFVSGDSVRRQVSLDVEILEANPYRVVPLALLVKQPLVALDVSDENGERLPVLTKAENGFVAWCAACAFGASIVEELLAPAVVQDLRRITSEDPSLARSLSTRFGASTTGDRRQRDVLTRHQGFAEVLAAFAENFILLVETDTDRRRIIKFAYDEPFSPPAELLPRISQQLGWTYTSFDFLIPGVGDSGSYHVEVEAPAELALDEAVFFVESGDQLEARPGRIVGQKAHVYVDDVPPSAYGMVSVWLRQPRPGVLRLSALMAFLTAVALTFYLINLQELRPSLTASLLLTIPGLLSIFIARPREHALATYFFFGIRCAIGLSALLAYVGAVALTIGPEEQNLLRLWRILTFMSWGCFIILVVSYFSLEPAIDLFDRIRARLTGGGERGR